MTYGAAIAGSEWAWGTLKASIARGEDDVVRADLVLVEVVIEVAHAARAASA